ncbi:hypothetical protein D3C71_1632050 [compost metagenome]
MHGAHHFFILLGAGHGQHAGVHLADHRFLDAHAAGDDDFAVLGQCFADGFQRFRLGAVDESTGIDDDDVRVVVFGRDFVPFGAQLRQDAFGVDQGFGTAQRHEPHARRATRIRALRGGRDGVQRRAAAIAGGSAGAFAGPGLFKDFQSSSP